MDPSWNNMLLEMSRAMAFIGAALAFGLGGMGSAKGIAIATQQATGVLSEKPDLFGRLLVMVALPGTQGFYGFVIAFLIAVFTGLSNTAPDAQLRITPGTGLALLLVGLLSGVVQYVSAIKQGEASAAGIALVARRPEMSGRALLFPALVETYAVVALLAALLFILWLTGPGATTLWLGAPPVVAQ